MGRRKLLDLEDLKFQVESFTNKNGYCFAEVTRLGIQSIHHVEHRRSQQSADDRLRQRAVWGKGRASIELRKAVGAQRGGYRLVAAQPFANGDIAEVE